MNHSNLHGQSTVKPGTSFTEEFRHCRHRTAGPYNP